jgi:hydrogenase maturation protease
MTRTLVIGLGNPILADDSVGIRVVRDVATRCAGWRGIDTVELPAGGLRLLDAMEGYDRLIMVDAMVSPDLPVPGRVHRLKPGDLRCTWNAVSLHDMSLETALALGALADLHLPTHIDIFGIEGANLVSFDEELTGDVARAVPGVVEEILGILNCSAEGQGGSIS